MIKEILVDVLNTITYPSNIISIDLIEYFIEAVGDSKYWTATKERTYTFYKDTDKLNYVVPACLWYPLE